MPMTVLKSPVNTQKHSSHMGKKEIKHNCIIELCTASCTRNALNTLLQSTNNLGSVLILFYFSIFRSLMQVITVKIAMTASCCSSTVVSVLVNVINTGAGRIPVTPFSDYKMGILTIFCGQTLLMELG